MTKDGLMDRARRTVQEAQHVVAFSGAGLSAESGVATFRDAATGGQWLKHDPMRLASQQGFREDPDLVIRWYSERRRNVARAEPNAAHRTLAAHERVMNVTQNVDDLLDRAGVKDVTRLHGTLVRDRCNAGCGFEEPIELADPPPFRPCPACGDHMRPSVVWFGEALPAGAWERAADTCTQCDAMLVVGTAAEVYPAAGLIDVARASGAAIIVINTQPSAASGSADLELIGPAGEVLPALLAS